ncbi:MAG TPA: hypothetical protein VHT53_03925 [Candidatus Elarobacter sp.]|jgi:hypothetical protein|nr:hypothetical protein [Candidatus Elarobacter sp.]
MDDAAALRAKIPGYADYADLDARRETDKRVRAYLGEALSEARERLTPSAALADRLDGLLLRCEFSDQRFVRAADHARFAGLLADRVHQLDRELIDCADRIRGAESPDELSALLDDAARALDERFGVVADARAGSV